MGCSPRSGAHTIALISFTIFPYPCVPGPYAVKYNAKLGLLIAVLLMSVGPAYAEWQVVDKDDHHEYAVYIDPDTIRRNGEVVKWWELWDHETVQTVAGESRLSMKFQREHDCAETLQRPLSQTWFAGNMGSGKVGFSNSNEGKWQPVQPGSIAQMLWKLACGKK